jgi:hypothetical protein
MLESSSNPDWQSGILLQLAVNDSGVDDGEVFLPTALDKLDFGMTH